MKQIANLIIKNNEMIISCFNVYNSKNYYTFNKKEKYKDSKIKYSISNLIKSANLFLETELNEINVILDKKFYKIENNYSFFSSKNKFNLEDEINFHFDQNLRFILNIENKNIDQESNIFCSVIFASKTFILNIKNILQKMNIYNINFYSDFMLTNLDDNNINIYINKTLLKIESKSNKEYFFQKNLSNLLETKIIELADELSLNLDDIYKICDMCNFLSNDDCEYNLAYFSKNSQNNCFLNKTTFVSSFNKKIKEILQSNNISSGNIVSDINFLNLGKTFVNKLKLNNYLFNSFDENTIHENIIKNTINNLNLLQLKNKEAEATYIN